MWPIALKHGSIAGLIVIASFWADIAFANSGTGLMAQWLGHGLMIVAMSMIFLGIRRYREYELDGLMGFLPGFGMGLLITAIAAIVHILAWEAYLAVTGYGFIADYTGAMADQLYTGELSDTEVAERLRALESLEANYASPFFRLVTALFEILPIGFIVTVASATILRKTPRRKAPA